MEIETAIVPGIADGDFVECAARSGVKPTGKLFRKQILRWGSFLHPKDKSKKITVDQAFAEKLIANFKDKVSGVVQFPVVNAKNEHVEDPTRNLGEIIDLDFDAEGINAYIDVRKHAEDIGTTILGASAMLHLNAERSKDGKQVGPALLHVAATNRPYLTDLGGFSEVLAASADTSGEAVLLEPVDEASTEGDEPKEQPSQEAKNQPEHTAQPEGEEMPKTKEELIAELKDQHGIDVEALEASAANSIDITALSAAGIDTSDGSPITAETLCEAIVEMSATNDKLKTDLTALSATVEKNENEKAAAEVDRLIGEGRILPKSRESMIKLSRSDREMFDSLVPEEAIVSLSEEGVTTHDQTNRDEVQAEVKRLAETYLNKTQAK